MIYMIGSLRNKNIPDISNRLAKETKFEIFDDWFSPGPRADDHWKEYEEARGRTYKQALKGYAGQHIVEFDKYHLDRADIGLLIMPAGKSAHLELGFILGTGRKGYILMDDNKDRWDVMVLLATKIFFNIEDLIEELKK